MKYIGSKARLVKEIKPIITANLGNRPYVEPFAGGFNMICEIDAPGGRYANDANEYLIAMFNALLRGWKPKKHYTREEYVEFRSGNGELHEIGYVGFNCSYSGKWFGGYAGITETKGGVRDYQAEAYRNVTKQVVKLGGVYTRKGSYLDMPIPDNSVIYCDPPYANTTGYVTGEFDHLEFWEWVRLVSQKHTIYVSEYQAPHDFRCVYEKQVKSSLSANGVIGGSKQSLERLFTL